MYIKAFLFIFITCSQLFASDEYDVKLNYFGNLSATKLDSSGFNINDYNSDNVNHHWKFSPYSKIGAQLSYYNDNITWTGQALVTSNHDDLELDVTWLNFKYAINNNFSIRLGRIQTKVLLYSASYEIDYLQLWVKPPSEVYRLMPIRTFNGIEIEYHKTFNDYNFQASFVTLASNRNIQINSTKDLEADLEVYNSNSLALTLENRRFTYKISYSQSNADIQDDVSTITIVKGLEAYGNNMSRYTFEDRLIKVASASFQYRGDKIVLESEIVRSKSDGLLPSSIGGYAIVGYKMDKFTPFFMYAENRNDKKHYDTSHVKISDATSEAFKTGLNDTLYVHNFSQKTSSLGLRYDIDIGMAFKAQVDRITSTNYGSISSATVNSTGYESIGLLTRDQGIADKAIYALTMSLSFAF